VESIEIIELDAKGGPGGWLIAVEQHSDQLPFELKRIYYIYGVAEMVRRGFHAHKALKQLLICVSGSCTIDIDIGNGRESFVLDRPNKGLFICRPAWREMYNFSKDCLLVVCASELYDKDDYIWDFSEFLAFTKSLSLS